MLFKPFMTILKPRTTPRCAMKKNLMDQPGLQNPLSQNPGTDYDELVDPVFTDGGTILEGDDVRTPGADPSQPEILDDGPDVIDDGHPDPQKRGI